MLCASTLSSTAQSARKLGRPTRTLCPSTTASIPSPAWLRNSLTAASSPAAFAIACARGCSEADSALPASRSNSSRVASNGTASTSRIRPSVTVPVLSSTIVVIRRVCSSTSGPLIRIPIWAPRPVPTISAVGVASPIAQGQAMIRTATAAANAADAPAPASSQPPRVPIAITITIGTKIAETRSASRCTRAFPVCACCTSRAIWASAVSAPTRVARTVRSPEVLIVAPATSAPGPTSTGSGSPVSIDWSIAEKPSVTTPSVATFSPGRTRNRSPTASCSAGTSTSTSSRSTSASFAPSSSSARIATPEERLARVSKNRPSRIRAVITAATSK